MKLGQKYLSLTYVGIYTIVQHPDLGWSKNPIRFFDIDHVCYGETRLEL